MRFVVVFIFFILHGCSSTITNADLENLNGYWEIEKVTFANGETKSFEPSSTIDYLEWNGKSGFRKKVQPKFNGSFETSNDAVFFTIANNDLGTFINYTESKTSRKEQIEHLSEEKLSLTHEDSIIYTYRRYQPIRIKE